MSHFPYQFFEEYVFRTPLFSRKKFQEKTEKSEIAHEALTEVCNDPAFREAIYLASPYVYNEMIRWLQSGKEDASREFQKLKNTILKYYSRTSTRCTPFGLFSEVGLGKFVTGKEIKYHSDLKKIRDTQLDMHFLVGLTQHFVKMPEIRNQLLFYPNNSIYNVGKRMRYVEYEYTKEKREYIISSAPLSEELKQVLDFCIPGKTIQQAAALLTNDEITQDEATEFIEELIDNQILVSALEPRVSGQDFQHTIISVLQKAGAQKEADALTLILEKLADLDLTVGNPIAKYTEIESMIRSFNVEYIPNHLFQTDLFGSEVLEMSSFWKNELKKGICFLNKIALRPKGSHLEEFKKVFYERFETQEVSLAYAMDTEVGIGYRQDAVVKGIHSYLDDLVIPLSQEKPNLKIELDPFQQILNLKIQEASLYGRYTIELSDDDVRDFEENWNDLPDTISFMTEIISENNELKLFFNGGGGSSAANLLGRFCSEKSEVWKLTQKITEKEEVLNPDYILAEIIHLPDARIGNVIRRPTLRSHEIPYLAQSVLPKETQLSVDDLYISLKNNRIVLRSKKLNKEIRPHLTNAHNYSANPLPVYHFLCDLSSQNRRSGVYFNWGDLKNIYQFLPRVEYKNIIFSKASWKITEDELQRFSLLLKDREQLFSALREWRNLRQIPQWIQWIKSDNKLTVNLENYDLAKMFFDAVRHEPIVIIEEFLYDENDDFKREFIFPVYRK
ncbi:lantibiotic dehydratase family protein [Chryseobacterium sp.]|uniref:lantibiotic dehydratase family protein n=1 Tax=Chryseobacterium sp. TaxID=1871047 RepID=UPI0025BAD83F|nr:lantibiotic dehydratase family protein [Chryseobacterium sp.]MBV8326376.1 lantibiotic dehydratase family protein [Chryseobacterium sp.]